MFVNASIRPVGTIRMLRIGISNITELRWFILAVANVMAVGVFHDMYYASIINN
jgi:hypothetical protein